MSRQPLDGVMEEAIDWMVDLRSGRDEDQQHRFEGWLAADPAHAQAWARLQDKVSRPYESLHGMTHQLPGHSSQVREVLMQPLVTRRSVLRSLSVIGVLGAGGWLASQSPAGQTWLADVSTGTGERKQFGLPDGSSITLNACSAVDLSFNPRERCVTLRQGDLVIEVQSGARPMQILTAQALVEALGPARIMVRQQVDASLVVALRGDVQVRSRFAPPVRSLAVEEAVMVEASGVRSQGLHQGHRADWLQGTFSAVDEPLQTLVDALRPYHAGWIRVSAEVRALRVQGVFALDRPDQALAAMAQTLPVRVERYGPWLTLISRRA